MDYVIDIKEKVDPFEAKLFIWDAVYPELIEFKRLELADSKEDFGKTDSFYSFLESYGIDGRCLVAKPGQIRSKSPGEVQWISELKLCQMSLFKGINKLGILNIFKKNVKILDSLAEFNTSIDKIRIHYFSFKEGEDN
jgi:hypothetical protein